METFEISSKAASHSSPHQIHSQDIDRALATVRHFSETKSPHANDFIVEQGAIKPKMLSPRKLMKAFFSSLFSPSKREEHKKRKRAIQQILDDSIQLIHIYSSRVAELKQGTPEEQGLADKVISVISEYNKATKGNNGDSIRQKIKTFFYEIAGWAFDEGSMNNQIPVGAFYQTHRFSIKTNDTTAKKVAAFSPVTAPLKTTIDTALDAKIDKQEHELFMMKAATLLTQHKIISQREIAATLSLARQEKAHVFIIHEGDKAISTRHLTISLFPGEDISITGSFEKSSAQTLSIPIQDSFFLNLQTLQTGFPRSQQASGFALSHKIVTSALLKSAKKNGAHKALLSHVQELAEALLPKGALNAQAKQLFRIRRQLIINNAPHITELLQKLMAKIIGAEEKTVFDEAFFRELHKEQGVVDQKNIFFTLASIHDNVIHRCLANADTAVPDRRLFLKTTYERKLQDTLAEPLRHLLNIVPISQRQNSIPLSGFEKKLVRSAFRQQLFFLSDSMLHPEDPHVEEKLFVSLKRLLLAEIADFSDTPLEGDHEKDELVWRAAMLAEQFHTPLMRIPGKGSP